MLDCTLGALNGISWYFNLKGSATDGTFIVISELVDLLWIFDVTYVILGHLIVVFSALYQLMDEHHPEPLQTAPVDLINPADDLFEYTFCSKDMGSYPSLISFTFHYLAFVLHDSLPYLSVVVM